MLRFAADVIERVVTPVGVVVVQDQAFHSGLRRDVDRTGDRRVAPGGFVVALDELRVVNEGVRALRERDDRIGLPAERVFRIRRVDEGPPVGLDAIGERGRWMEDLRRADAIAADELVRAVTQLPDLERRGQVVDVHWKERVVHALSKQLLDWTRLLRPADAQRAVRVIGRPEEGDALDVIPVQMRQQQIDRERTRPVRAHERDAELAQTGSRVEHEQRAGRVTHLDA